MSEIKAIETRYKGYRFRSRLEARWAVFFDALELRFEYEKEGFHLPSGRLYLPDFWIPSLACWAEIKPLPDSFEGQPWMERGSLEEEFFGDTKENGFVIFGTPGEPKPYNAASPYACAVFGDSPYLWCVCPSCGKVGIEFDGRGARICRSKCMGDDDKGYTYDDPKLLAAFERALSARWEHGESPR